MTMTEVARRIRVPLETLRKWRMTGGGPPGVKMGVRVMFRRADVEAWINAKFEPPVSPPAIDPPNEARAEARYFPWCYLVEAVSEAVAEVFDPTRTEMNTINNAVWDALPDTYDAYMTAVANGSPHAWAQGAAMKELRDGLAQHLRPLRKARKADIGETVADVG
jgi:excisionase family DNA binding protein